LQEVAEATAGHFQLLPVLKEHLSRSSRERDHFSNCVQVDERRSGNAEEAGWVLTGGSSLVPAVRRIFERRFGADRIRTGSEFTSVAQGLALKASEIA
jgi:hypothetical chaperone protein